MPLLSRCNMRNIGDNMIKSINLPLQKKDAEALNVGDTVYLNGSMFVFRDAGHKRLFQSIDNGCPDIDYKGETIYFMGPCPALEGQIMGSCGPTTSCRMDKYTPYMFNTGLAAQIGKGKRSADCVEAIKRNKGVYFAAIGGAGAIYSSCVTDVKEICYPDLGTEAIRRITVNNFPVIVAVDSKGRDIYDR